MIDGGPAADRKTHARRDRLTIFFDGGCHPNPGPIDVALVTQGRTIIREALGEGDSSVAEWLALRQALDLAIAIGAADVLLIGDSATVIQQALGLQRCRDDRLRQQRDAFLLARPAVPRVQLRWVKRSRNLAGIALDRFRWRRAG